MDDFSYQLYSSRKFPPLSATVRMVADAGYTQVEGFGGILADADEVAELSGALHSHGLSMPTAHVGLEVLESDPGRVLEMVGVLGIRAVFAPYLVPGERPSDAAGWRALGARLAAVGRLLGERGIAFGWHNHDFEFRPLDSGEYPITLMLDAAPEIGLEMDLAWIRVAGEDPVAWVERYADRLIAVHLKDIAPEGECANEDGWADVGHGTMDWPAINAALARTGVAYRVMEHDNPSDDRRFAERSIAAARAFR